MRDRAAVVYASSSDEELRAIARRLAGVESEEAIYRRLVAQRQERRDQIQRMVDHVFES